MANTITDGTTASSTNYYTQDYVGNLTNSTPLTETEIKSIIKGIDQQIVALMFEGGPAGVAPYENTNQETGFKVDPTKALSELRNARQYYAGLLSDPDHVLPACLWSQWDDPSV